MKKYILHIVLSLLLFSCQKDEESKPSIENNPSNPSTPTAYNLSLPDHFVYIDPPNLNQENPLTVEGIALGKRLFFERRLSVNNSISCASCHRPEFAFNDPGRAFSRGATGSLGIRNAMPLFNLAFSKPFTQHGSFNWHGSTKTLQEQALGPVKDPLEMMETWTNVAQKLSTDPIYPSQFNAAFGSTTIDSISITKALEQFESTLISGESKADNEIRKRNSFPYTGPALNAQELRGYDLYLAENKGDCSHCHGQFPNPLWTDFEFRNNGLDANPDSGLASVTKKASDIGKFKTPSLRNLVFTAPYMHDGRFSTLSEVIDFYTGTVQSSPTIDPTMLKNRSLTANEKADLIAFLEAITDSAFVRNPAYRFP